MSVLFFFLSSTQFTLILQYLNSFIVAQQPTMNSLVKYDNPTLVSTGGKGKGKLPAVDGKQRSQTEDILISILPLR